MQVRKQQLELDIEQQTGSKKEKENVWAVCCNLDYLFIYLFIYLYAEYLNCDVGEDSWESLGL